MLILVCNAGSTSLKFKLLSFPKELVLAECGIERIGDPGKGIWKFGANDERVRMDNIDVPDYETGIGMFMQSLHENGIAAVEDIDCIGFKTVMAKGFDGIHELTDEVMEATRVFLPVAPVHNKAYIECIDVMKRLFPDVLLMGVFESAFHATIPEYERIYALPWQWYSEYGIKRLGFHGASHGYIAGRVGELYGQQHRAISCHLGGSSSICAIKDGASMANSFGFTPQTGIPHSSRAGDFDIFSLPYLDSLGKTVDQVLDELSHDGGVKGISGVSNDMREIEQAAQTGSERALLAMKHYSNEIVKHIGAYYACLGGLDTLVFTAGIGENSIEIRRMICEALIHMGIELDEEKNKHAQGECTISTPSSKVRVCVLPTNEELALSRQLYRCLTQGIKNDIWRRADA